MAGGRRRPVGSGEGLVVGEEHHLDWIDTQKSMIADIGIERYLQSMIGEPG